MKKIIQLIVVLSIFVVGVGFYRGWFTVTREQEAVSHNIDVKLSVDTAKVRHDAETVKDGLKPGATHNDE